MAVSERTYLESLTDEEQRAALCLILENCAYFTTQPLDKQDGEGWYKQCYDSNASPPNYGEHHTIYMLHFDVNAKQPRHYGDGRTPFSVRDINAGAIAWLWVRGSGGLFAGATMREFVEYVYKHGGTVYAPLRKESEDA